MHDCTIAGVRLQFAGSAYHGDNAIVFSGLSSCELPVGGVVGYQLANVSRPKIVSFKRSCWMGRYDLVSDRML